MKANTVKAVDRITEALERAQKNGPGVTIGTEEILKPSLTPIVPVVPVAERIPAGPQNRNIVYSRTRVADVALKVLADRHIVVEGANRDLVNSIKLIRTQIVQKMRENGWKSLAIVSPSDDEGKTFMAVNFAVSLAMEFDQTCLLVDADLRRPGVHKYFDLPAAPGLSNYLVNHTSLDSCLVNPSIERLVVLPGGTPQVNSAELLGSTQMAALVADLKARYSDRVIVFDLPPIVRRADALAFMPLVDCVVMVVAEGESTRDEVMRARQLLGRANLIGVVMNMSDEPFDPEEDDDVPRRGFISRLFGRK
jgi:protein-tyrosine kinase